MSTYFNKSILKVKDDKGNIIGIPAIKGDKGDSGVYVGSGDMPDGYNIQLDTSGVGRQFTIPEVFSVTGDSEVDTMSQKAITDALNNLYALIGDKPVSTQINNVISDNIATDDEVDSYLGL